MPPLVYYCFFAQTSASALSMNGVDTRKAPPCPPAAMYNAIERSGLESIQTIAIIAASRAITSRIMPAMKACFWYLLKNDSDGVFSSAFTNSLSTCIVIIIERAERVTPPLYRGFKKNE